MPKATPKAKGKAKTKQRKHGSQRAHAKASPKATLEHYRGVADEQGPLPPERVQAIVDDAYSVVELHPHLRQLAGLPGGAPSPTQDHGQYPRVLRLLCLSAAYKHLPYLIEVVAGEAWDTVVDAAGVSHQVPVKHSTRIAAWLGLARIGMQGVQEAPEGERRLRRAMAVPHVEAPQ